LHRSAKIVAKLSALFALDSFAGGFIVQSLLALWFHKRFNVDAAALGAVFFAANILAALSFLAAARIAARIGLINTMVFTHIPSNVLLIAVPFMPTFETAVAVLLVRYCICQMDVPTRQSYTMAVVSPDERSAAGGVTGVARSVGGALSPALSGALLGSAVWSGAPLVIAGALKIAYDLLLYRSFKTMKPPEERD
jgi:predicted MFS family arabinose efflux permease